MMRAENLKITFNPGTPIENPALRGMSLSIDDGEFVTVIGSNGAGKCYFLNAISGDLAVDRASSASIIKMLPDCLHTNAHIWWRACFKTRWPALAKP